MTVILIHLFEFIFKDKIRSDLVISLRNKSLRKKIKSKSKKTRANKKHLKRSYF
jgi:hypothetical protein